MFCKTPLTDEAIAAAVLDIHLKGLRQCDESTQMRTFIDPNNHGVNTELGHHTLAR